MVESVVYRHFHGHPRLGPCYWPEDILGQVPEYPLGNSLQPPLACDSDDDDGGDGDGDGVPHRA